MVLFTSLSLWWVFQNLCGSVGKESACNAGDLGLIPGLGRSPGGGHGNPLNYSCLENPCGQRSLVGYSTQGHTVGPDLTTNHMFLKLIWQAIIVKFLVTSNILKGSEATFTLLTDIFITRDIHNWAPFLLCPSHFILSRAISNCPLLFPSSILDIFQPKGAHLPASYLFAFSYLLFMEFSR